MRWRYRCVFGCLGGSAPGVGGSARSCGQPKTRAVTPSYDLCNLGHFSPNSPSCSLTKLTEPLQAFQLTSPGTVHFHMCLIPSSCFPSQHLFANASTQVDDMTSSSMSFSSENKAEDAVLSLHATLAICAWIWHISLDSPRLAQVFSFLKNTRHMSGCSATSSVTWMQGVTRITEQQQMRKKAV